MAGGIRSARRLGDSRGSVMLETAVMLPVILLAALLGGQFAHIWYARQMVGYAAYCAARSGLVNTTANGHAEGLVAAKAVCSVISLTAASDTTNSELTLPWIGTIAGSQDVADKMTLTYSEENSCAKVELQFYFPLIFPFVNHVMSGLMGVFSDDGGLPHLKITQGTASTGFQSRSNDIFPHILLTERAILPKPYTLAN